MSRWLNHVAILSVLACPLSLCAESSSEEAFQKLVDGNKRYVSGRLSRKDLGDEKRRELAKEQHPWAVVITCADSRVSPELLFDQGLGELFVIRVAGNVVDKLSLGSVEYGIEHLHAPLLIVLGHQSCGAVKAALESTGNPEGNIGEIIKKIKPAAIKAKNSPSRSKSDLLDNAVQENVRNVYREILEKSAIVKGHQEEGKLKVVIGEYYLESGKVQFLLAPEEETARIEEEKPKEPKSKGFKPSRPFPAAEPGSKKSAPERKPEH